MHTNPPPSSEIQLRKPTRKNSIILFAFIASVLSGVDHFYRRNYAICSCALGN